MNGPAIRCWRLTPDHAARWRDIRLEALANAPDSFGVRLSDWQHRPLRDFAARLTAVPTYASGDTTDRPLAVGAWEADHRAAGRAWLISVYARPEGRGRGYAAALIEHICVEARRAGLGSIGLDVGVHNTAARRLYARLGFRETGEAPHLNENGIAEMPMLRTL